MEKAFLGSSRDRQGQREGCTVHLQGVTTRCHSQVCKCISPNTQTPNVWDCRFSPSIFVAFYWKSGCPQSREKGVLQKVSLTPPLYLGGLYPCILPFPPRGKTLTGRFTRGTNPERRPESGISSKLPLQWEYECFVSITFNSDCLGNLWPAVIKY